MARREETHAIALGGRDDGKVFIVREMPALQAERWAYRAIRALANSGADVPPELLTAGMAALPQIGLQAWAGVPLDEADALMGEMLACVFVQPDPAKAFTRPVMPDEIEEIATLLYLRGAVLKIHVDFTKVVARLNSLRDMLNATTDALTTSTSPQQSDTSSPAV